MRDGTKRAFVARLVIHGSRICGVLSLLGCVCVAAWWIVEGAPLSLPGCRREFEGEEKRREA